MNLLDLSAPDQQPHPAEPPSPLPGARYEGGVDVISEWHVIGWSRNAADDTHRVRVEAKLAATGEVLASTDAEIFIPGLRKIGIGDGEYGFQMRLPRRLTPEEQNDLLVCPVGSPASIPRSQYLVSTFQPAQFIIMDIVDNCNLRCPFCVYDYSHTHRTNMMDEALFAAALRFAPFVTEGNFWFSCLHEPSLHPRFADFITLVPPQYRSKIFFTTNLAKRMPPDYFRTLANSGLHHVNVSIESLDPPVYEKMRKGARFRIFKENWDHLVAAFRAAERTPALRYISLAYKSTYRQLPEVVEHLLQDRCGSIVEVRHTYDVPHIARSFRKQEYLRRDEWLWLRDRLASFTPQQLLLDLPPGIDDPAFDEKSAAHSEQVATMYEKTGPAPSATAAPAPAPFSGKLPKGYTPGNYGMRIFWDGRVEVNAVWIDPDQPPPAELRLLTTHLRDIPDAEAFLTSLPV